jgi:serine/threonine protein kinase
MSFGKIIGDYELIGKINKGGIAEIHKARHRSNGSVYALRIMLPEISKTSRNVRLFVGGAEIVRQLDHPNIIRVLDVVLDKEMPYVVMEYVEGDNLKHCLLHNDPVVTERPLEILMQVAQGIQHLHNNRILHRDIKPENILISEKMEVKIADFSLAVRKEKDQLTSRLISGSRSYIAPERILQDRYDERADIYGMGITAYELLSGRLPYTGTSDQEVLSKHVSRRVRPPAIRRLNPSVPRELEKIVMTCIKKDPAKRYPDVGLVIRDLEKARLLSRPSA